MPRLWIFRNSVNCIFLYFVSNCYETSVFFINCNHHNSIHLIFNFEWILNSKSFE